MFFSNPINQHAFYRDFIIYVFAVVASMLLSLIALAGDEVVNTDGVMYLQSARFFYLADWANGFAADLTKFPLYPMLIALVANFAGLAIEDAAYAISIFIDAACVVVFMRLVCELSDRASNRGELLIFAGITILSFTQLNDYRTLIIRDHGFWLFYLLSILLFVYYWRKPTLSNAFMWGGVSVIASLFRIEGIIFLLAMPVAALFKPGNLKLHALEFLRVYIILLPCIVAALGVAVYGFLFSDNAYIIDALNMALTRGMGYLSATPIDFLTQKAEALSTLLFTGTAELYSKQYAFIGVMAVLCVIFFSKLFSVLGFVFAMLLMYAAHMKVLPSKSEARICYWALFVNVLIVSVFLVNQFFLTGRYLVPLVFMLMLAVPFGLCALYERWQTYADRSNKNYWLFPAVCLVLFGMAIDGVVSFGPSKQYVRDAANWLNTNVPSGAVLVSDNSPLLFHSGLLSTVLKRGINAEEKVSGIAGKRVYWAAKVSRKKPSYEQDQKSSKNILPIKTFQNERGDRILIYYFED